MYNEIPKSYILHDSYELLFSWCHDASSYHDRIYKYYE